MRTRAAASRRDTCPRLIRLHPMPGATSWRRAPQRPWPRRATSDAERRLGRRGSSNAHRGAITRVAALGEGLPSPTALRRLESAGAELLVAGLRATLGDERRADALVDRLAGDD